ncbi:hypothetical protein LXL04_016070 [Taraxacum kok-saghyz]
MKKTKNKAWEEVNKGMKLYTVLKMGGDFKILNFFRMKLRLLSRRAFTKLCGRTFFGKIFFYRVVKKKKKLVVHSLGVFQSFWQEWNFSAYGNWFWTKYVKIFCYRVQKCNFQGMLLLFFWAVSLSLQKLFGILLMVVVKFVKFLQKLMVVMCGSSALPVPVMQRWETITGHRILERYGMTEFVMALSALGGIFGKYGGTATVQFLGQFGFMADMQQFDFGLPGFFGMDLDMTALGDEEVIFKPVFELNLLKKRNILSCLYIYKWKQINDCIHKSSKITVTEDTPQPLFTCTLGMIFAYLVPKVCISLIARPETLELLLQFAELELQVAALYAHRCCLRFWTILPLISFLLMAVAWLLGCCLAVAWLLGCGFERGTPGPILVSFHSLNFLRLRFVIKENVVMRMAL